MHNKMAKIQNINPFYTMTSLFLFLSLSAGYLTVPIRVIVTVAPNFSLDTPKSAIFGHNAESSLTFNYYQ